MPCSRPGGTPSTFTATLRCGVVLTYEASSFVPQVDEVVPCRRHGYCPVASREWIANGGPRGARRVAPRRSQGELLEFLSHRPVTSVHALREHRFTLRMVTAAQKHGLVDVDLVSGRIALRREAAA